MLETETSILKSSYLLPPLQAQMSPEYYSTSIMDVDNASKGNLEHNINLFALTNQSPPKVCLTERGNKTSLRERVKHSDSLKEDSEKLINKTLQDKRENSKTLRLLRKSFYDFNKKVEAISVSNHMESTEIDHSITKTLSSIRSDYDGLIKKKDQSSIPQDILNLQRQRHFKNNLTEHIISRIADKYAFYNAYNNKNKNDELSESIK